MHCCAVNFESQFLFVVDNSFCALLRDQCYLPLLLPRYFDDAPEKFELSMAIPVSIYRYETGFDLVELQKSVHFFNGKPHP